MCDTFVALSTATADGSVIFGKNSDREPNEAHELVLEPAADHAPGDLVQCTYRAIPQVAHTYAVLLAKPFWIWGAEMGANEHGVAIGNEAVFSRFPAQKEPGLIGMDFLRLALERSRSADEALQTITELLEQYGQGGSCGFTQPFFYHNSYLIADRTGAWILETVDRQWAAVRVRDVGSISNAITIGSAWDLASKDLVQTAVQRGWCRHAADFHFARCYSDPFITRVAAAASRQTCTSTYLVRQRGRLTPVQAMNLLRDHGPAAAWRPDRALAGASVCMHAAFGPARANQSTGSMISVLRPDGDTHWLTGTSAPCTGLFKPVWMDAGLPEHGPRPTGKADPESLFWRHERLHRDVLRAPAERLAAYAPERDELEQRWAAQAAECRVAGAAERAAFSRACFQAARQAEERWLAQVQAVPARPTAFYYRQAWAKFDRQAGLGGGE